MNLSERDKQRLNQLSDVLFMLAAAAAAAPATETRREARRRRAEQRDADRRTARAARRMSPAGTAAYAPGPAPLAPPPDLTAPAPVAPAAYAVPLAPSDPARIRPPVLAATEGTRAARRLDKASALLACSVLMEGVGESRPEFLQAASWAERSAAALTLAASLHGAGDPVAGAGRRRGAIQLLAAGVGAFGVSVRRPPPPGRLRFLPSGAPAALLLAGTFGLAAERVRATRPTRRARLLLLPAGRLLGLAASAGLFGATRELPTRMGSAWHPRGFLRDPVLPAVLPPVAAALTAGAALGRSGRRHPFLRWMLGLVAALGLLGTGGRLWTLVELLRARARSRFAPAPAARPSPRPWGPALRTALPAAQPRVAGLALAALAGLRLMERRDAE